jgi:hypothetical protein
MAIEYTLQLFGFDVVAQVFILVAIMMMYLRTKELSSLSLQKGIKYLNYAMLSYLLSFTFRFVSTIYDFFLDNMFGTYTKTIYGLVFSLFNIYGALLGGFFLAYCLVWRRFEKDQIMKCSIGRVVSLYLISLMIVIADIHFMLIGYFITAYFFYISVFTMLLYAIITSHKVVGGKITSINPFLSLVGLGLGVYAVTLIENLLVNFLFTVHYYSLALSAIF